MGRPEGPRRTECAMTRWLLIHPIAGGNHVDDQLEWLNQDDLDGLLNDAWSSYGVRRFRRAEEHMDLGHWDEGDALLLKVEVVTPEHVIRAWRLPT